jgi:phospholipid/cholesterol/gamma-HCH transport system substrate-binding protein
MSQKANPTLIGAFVFGAIVIAIGAVIYFGSANLFARKQAFVTYFQQSVNGLGIGSNVKYKGVPVGKVTRIQLQFEGRNQPPIVKVLYEIDTTNLLNRYGLSIELADRKTNDRAIQNGFRAKLDFESLISGQLYIALDFYKDAAPVVLHGQANSEVFEIPPQPSDIEAILADLTKAIGNLGSIDFAALAKDVQSLIVSARNGIDSMHLDQLGASLNRASDSASALLNGDQVKGALTSINESFDQLTTTLKSLNPAVGELKPTLDQAKGALANLQRSTAELNQILKPDSNLRYQLDSLLSEISAAAASIQQLSDFLQRHPNSILFGRRPNANQP